MITWLTAAALLAVDQLSKGWARTALSDGLPHAALPRLLTWVFVQNRRGAYGLFGDAPALLVAIAGIAFVVVWLAFRERARRSPAVALALGCVMGGAVGNVVDRLHLGYVVDFIHLDPLPIFEVFNVADVGITLGIVAMVLTGLRAERAA